jgi:hypothetical protein
LLDDPRTPPLARAVAQDSVRLAERGSRIRRPRLDAIRRVVALDQAAAASVPLGTVIDVRATWEFDFLEAFRRRLAYALGFEASLLAGSPRPYLELEALLVSDSLAGLRAYLPPASARTAFSIHLNLLARLRAALAADLPVVDAAEKDAVLSAGLHTAAERKQADLTSDAQVAVRAVLAELDVFLLRPLPYSPHPPLWGSLAPSSAYRDLGS